MKSNLTEIRLDYPHFHPKEQLLYYVRSHCIFAKKYGFVV